MVINHETWSYALTWIPQVWGIATSQTRVQLFDLSRHEVEDIQNRRLLLVDLRERNLILEREYVHRDQ